MLSHKVLRRQDIGRAASYYEDGADDYYANDGDASEWQGKGAEMLALSGPVDSARFRQLLAGEAAPGMPVSRSATRGDSRERIGLDLTFSAPKSVSLQALVSGDPEIVKAHDRAVARAVTVAETLAQARKKVGGKSRIETTGNLIVAKFRHETSREGDPQLHTHAVVMNLTRRSDGEWRALKNDQIVKATRTLGAVYRAELAHELTRLGYPIRHERDGLFELAHIGRDEIAAFSRRSAGIEERLAADGLTRETASSAEKQQAAMESRPKKTETDRTALHSEWRKRARDIGIDFARRDWAGPGGDRERGGPADAAPREAAKRAVRYAVNHLTERQAVIEERDLIDTAATHAVGLARLPDIQAEIAEQTRSGFLIRESPLYRPAGDAHGDGAPGKTRLAWIAEIAAKGLGRDDARARVDAAIAQGGLVPGEARVTTQTALEREKRILQIEREGRRKVAPVMDADSARERLAAASLDDGQLAAAELIATTTNRVIGVQGLAGTGKSHMLNAAKTLIKDEGCDLRALAPYGSQVKALRELGVPANTLASFVKAKEKNIGPKTVLVIDEAGVVPTRLMEQTLKIAENAGARVVLVGDTAQTKAIEAGRPFDQLQAAGMATARMTEIRRQKDPELKRAVELAAKGDTGGSLRRIREVTEIADHGERRAAVAAAFVSLAPHERDRTLIVSGTNEARREINAQVRDGLGLAGKGLAFDTLVRRDTTQAERRHSKTYRVGDAIQPERDYPKSGLARGEIYTVVDTGPGNRLTVRSERDGATISFSPKTHRKLSVYEPQRAELAPGDVVRVTRNDAGLDLANGDRFRVAKVEADRVTLSDGKRRVELSADKPLHLDHAYATTVHSAQGLTADRVLIDAHAGSRTTAKDVYYVAISRARHEAHIFTNDRLRLPAAIARENDKSAALDLARDGQIGVRRRSRLDGEGRDRRDAHGAAPKSRGSETGHSRDGMGDGAGHTDHDRSNGGDHRRAREGGDRDGARRASEAEFREHAARQARPSPTENEREAGR